MPKNATSASRETPPSILGAGSGLSPKAIEAHCPVTVMLDETRPIGGTQAADGRALLIAECCALRGPRAFVAVLGSCRGDEGALEARQRW